MDITRNIDSKEDFDSFVNGAIELVLSGEIDPLGVEINIRQMLKALTAVQKDVRVKRYVSDEASKYDGQMYRGHMVKLTNRKTSDYSADNQWLTLKASLKAREALLKETKGVDPDTGEVVVTYKVSEVLNIKL